MMFDKFKIKIKEKIKNISKNEFEQSFNEINKDVRRLNKDVKRLNKDVKTLKKENDSYHRLFKTLFLDYELTPKGAAKTSFLICQELLNFVDNVCKKHDIEYWLDYGNLMGAVRHNGFIPWDDDMDVGMMRIDFDKFYQVVQDEFKRTGLDDIITMTRDKIYGERKVIFFIQISIQDDDGRIYGGLDVFPYDYLIDEFDDFNEKFEKVRIEYRNNFFDGMEYEDNIKYCFDELHLSNDKQKFIISGFDSLRSKKSVYNPEVLDSDKIFPLSTVNFNGQNYPCPNDSDYYLTKIYGDYMDFPKVLRFHERLNSLRNNPDLEKLSKEFYLKLKEVNNNF